MKKELLFKEIVIKEGVILTLYPIGNNAKIFEIDLNQAEEFGEAPIQILESRRYEYEFSNPKYQLETSIKLICIPSRSKTNSRGIISPGNYVGTLELNVFSDEERIKYHLEVLATKFDVDDDFDKSYRQNYRSMIEDITDKCTELLMQSNSPVNQYFEPDFNKDNNVLYQKFSFVKSIINKEEFEESMLRIFSSPKTSWINRQENADIRSVKRFSNRNIQELLRGNNRIPLPRKHNLYGRNGLESIPSKINSYKQESSLDNPENRFIKHALEVYLQFCESCSSAFEEDSKDQKEADYLANKLESFLNHSFFQEISRPTTLKLNSPTLQRKSGYREILKSWLMFDLASKLTWTGGEDVYNAGKRDIATLYEYWLFFVLYDLFKSKFNLTKLTQDDEYAHLFEITKKGLNLIIKSGQHTALEGSTIIRDRDLNIKFSFNRTFSGYKDSYPKSGSWTTAMRPDYTLTVWPKELKEKEAEEQELIVHIHFDAKYKVNNFKVKSNGQNETLTKEDERKILDNLKNEERAGIFKNADLLKMHAYKDAIRRTGGAYILYPGTKETIFKGFHELIPGLGAFSLNPNNQKADILALSNFIDKVILNLVNRASQRENIAHKRYSIHKNDTPNEILEAIPEYFNNVKLIPDETHVLVGFSKNKERLNWYKENGLYNFRMDDDKGSLIFTDEVVNAKFLLLRESGKSQASHIFRIKPGVRVFSKEKLQGLGLLDLRRKNYLVYEFVSEEILEFKNSSWNFKELKEYQKTIEGKNLRSAAGIPFVITLSELMNVLTRA